MKVVRQTRQGLSDQVASAMVAISRRAFDVITRYKVTGFPFLFPPLQFSLLNPCPDLISQHASPEAARLVMEKEGLTNLSLDKLRKRGFVMTIKQWMLRILFLETIAGVPGMVRFSFRVGPGSDGSPGVGVVTVFDCFRSGACADTCKV